jgi:hypothetical protein
VAVVVALVELTEQQVQVFGQAALALQVLLLLDMQWHKEI